MYLIIIIILLLVLLQLNLCKDIILFSIILITVFIISKNVLLSIFVSSIIYLILRELNNMNIYERFDEKKEDHNKETNNRVKHLKSIIDKLEKGLSLNENDLKVNNTIKDHDFDDSKETDDDDDDIISKKKTSNMTAYEAQKQTYKLIDTVKQLSDTIETLKPTIDNGNEILKKLENFELTKQK